jgi:hypothetical protein
VVHYVTRSSVCIRLKPGTLDVHYPCDGPYRVLLNLALEHKDHDPDTVKQIRLQVFRELGIPRGESWELHVSLLPVRCVRSDRGEVVALPTASRRAGSFFGGLAWLCLLAFVLSAVLQASFWAVLLGLFLVMLLVGGLAFWWLTLWALRKDGRLGQFGIGSLLFLTLFVAIYLSAVRWLITMLPGAPVQGCSFLIVALIGLVPVAISIPILLPMLDAILWAAVWLKNRFQQPNTR